MNEEQKIMSFSANGLDSPGLVSKITTKVFELGGNVTDVEENCRRGLFSIFLIIDFSSSTNSMHEITNTLKTLENETDLKVNVGIYSDRDITHLTKKENHLVTILGIDHPGVIASVSSFFHKNNINIENCRMIAHGKFFSMETIINSNKMIYKPPLSPKEAIEKMKGELKDLCAKMNQSVVIQSENIYNKMKKLVVFDVESTLIRNSSLKNFLDKIKGKVKSIDGRIELNHNAKDPMLTLIKNARSLQGLPAVDFERFGEALKLNPGSLELIGILKSMGFKVALLSSGFNFFIKRVFEEAGVDYAFSNTLKIDENGKITGQLEEPIISSDTKDQILEFIIKAENISRDQVIAIGDGSTRSHFIKNAGLSIAFKPEEINVKTDGILSSDQITNILYCLGIPKTELEKYL